MALDDQRLGLNKDQHADNQYLEGEKKTLKEELSAKKKELNSSALEVAKLEKKFEDAQQELSLKNSQLEESNKKIG